MTALQEIALEILQRAILLSFIPDEPKYPVRIGGKTIAKTAKYRGVTDRNKAAATATQEGANGTETEGGSRLAQQYTKAVPASTR